MLDGSHHGEGEHDERDVTMPAMPGSVRNPNGTTQKFSIQRIALSPCVIGGIVHSAEKRLPLVRLPARHRFHAYQSTSRGSRGKGGRRV